MKKVFISVGYRYKNEETYDRKTKKDAQYYQNAVPDVILSPQIICPDAFSLTQSEDEDDEVRNIGLGKLTKDMLIQLTEYLSVPGQTYHTAEPFLVAFACEETYITDAGSRASDPGEVLSVQVVGEEEIRAAHRDNLQNIVLVDKWGQERTGVITSFAVLDTANYNRCVKKQFAIRCSGNGNAAAAALDGNAAAVVLDRGVAVAVQNGGVAVAAQNGGMAAAAQNGGVAVAAQNGGVAAAALDRDMVAAAALDRGVAVAVPDRGAPSDSVYNIHLRIVTKMSPGVFEKIIDDLKTISIDLLRGEARNSGNRLNYIDTAGLRFAGYKKQATSISRICEELRESPESDVISEERSMPFDKVKQLNSRTILDHYILGKQKVRTTVHTQSFDTYENRKIKAYIQMLLKEMNFFRKNVDQYKEENQEELREIAQFDDLDCDIDAEIQKLNRVLSLPMFRNVAGTNTRLHATNLFTNHPKYARAYKLMKGSDEIREILDLAPQYDKVDKTDEIYEFWCYFKVISILTDTLGFQITDIRKPKKKPTRNNPSPSEEWMQVGKDGRKNAALLLKNAMKEWQLGANGTTNSLYGIKIQLKKENMIMQVGYNYSLITNATTENGEHLKPRIKLAEHDCSEDCPEKNCILLHSVNWNDVRPDIYINVWKDEIQEQNDHLNTPNEHPDSLMDGSPAPEHTPDAQSTGMIGRVDDRHHIITLDAKYQDYCNANGERGWQTEILNCAYFKHVYRAGAEYSFILHPGIRNEEEITLRPDLKIQLSRYDDSVKIKTVMKSYLNSCPEAMQSIAHLGGKTHRIKELEMCDNEIRSEGQSYEIHSVILLPGRTDKLAARLNDILEYEI